MKAGRFGTNRDLLDALKVSAVQSICDPQDAAQETDDPLIGGGQRGVVQMVEGGKSLTMISGDEGDPLDIGLTDPGPVVFPNQPGGGFVMTRAF